MGKHISTFLHGFSSLENIPFPPEEYSFLKFGSDRIAKKFGCELAQDVFAKHSDLLLAERAVVIPSPYNVVPNAATVMAEHFMNHLNQLLVEANGEHLDWSIIHRKISYTSDYGFLTKEKRRGLIDNDSFYLNRGFLDGKILIFVDDVRITGTHEEKLVEILEREKVDNDVLFVYYGSYDGSQPNIEAQINGAGIHTMSDYLTLCEEPGHRIIVRPIKFLLSRPAKEFAEAAKSFPRHVLEKLYAGCLSEGYYRIPHYQQNFQTIARLVKEPV